MEIGRGSVSIRYRYWSVEPNYRSVLRTSRIERSIKKKRTKHHLFFNYCKSRTMRLRKIKKSFLIYSGIKLYFRQTYDYLLIYIFQTNSRIQRSFGYKIRQQVFYFQLYVIC
ncbi:hypothetical protein ANTPLA_LOCUS6643 [Anthophora plagiata]